VRLPTARDNTEWRAAMDACLATERACHEVADECEKYARG
jgi:hypothetical protein